MYDATSVNACAQLILPWWLARRARVLGVQGPQGCGKSTAAAALVELAVVQDVRAVTVSIDDFYLTHAEQQALAERHPNNPYLEHRGYPGTHDVALGTRTLDALRSCGAGEAVSLPVYDKSAHAGRGDRAPSARWRRVVGPFDLVIIEGWMLGFAPVDEAELDPRLAVPNRLLAAYGAWNQRLDALVHLTVGSLETIVAWRVDSERARRAQNRGEGALSDEQAADYIRRFLPAYRLYVPRLEAAPPCAELFTIELGPNREPLHDG